MEQIFTVKYPVANCLFSLDHNSVCTPVRNVKKQEESFLLSDCSKSLEENIPPSHHFLVTFSSSLAATVPTCSFKLRMVL